MTSKPPPDLEEPGSRPRAPSSGSGGPAQRPRWLVVALVGALVFGAGCWTEGCSRLAFYRGEPDRHAELTDAIQGDADRAKAEALYEQYVDVAEAARGKAVPLAAATFVLGAALLALGARGLAGRANTRTLLMQVVTAQAGLVVATYFVLRPVLAAEADWQYGTVLIQQQERMPPEQFAQAAPTLHAMRRWVPPGWLVLRTVASGLIVLALSRPRARAFFEASTRAVSER